MIENDRNSEIGKNRFDFLLCWWGVKWGRKLDHTWCAQGIFLVILGGTYVVLRTEPGQSLMPGKHPTCFTIRSQLALFLSLHKTSMHSII